VVDDRALAAIIERAAAGAWRLAAGDGAAAADEELLLTELRAQRVATATALATALGRDAATVRAQLDELYEQGAVLRTGSGERTRYRAAAS
jgi:predicted ArsR family transcriptional regulator